MGAPTTANTVLNLTTLARVKASLNLSDVQTLRDTALQQDITAISLDIASRLKRWTKSERRTELVSFNAGRKSIAVRGAPMTAVHKVELSDTDDFSTVTALTANTDFHSDLRLGLIHLRVDAPALRRGATRWAVFPTQARIEYTGGMAASTDAFVVAFSDMAQVVEQQVAYLHQRRTRNALGSNSSLGANGETKFEGVYKDLPGLLAIVARYERRGF